MAISALVNSGLLPFSDAYLFTSNSSGTSATADQSRMQLLGLVKQQQGNSVASAGSSAQLAADSYTPSGQTQASQSSGSSSNTSSSTPTLASLIKNQTISGSADVRQALLDAIQPYLHDNVSDTWNTLANKVNSGDLSGAQAALNDYTTALTNSHYDVSGVSGDRLAALGNALQAGNQSDAEAALYGLGTETTDIGLGYLTCYEIGYGTSLNTPGGVEWAAQDVADALQKVGYTASNATVEANAIMLGLVAQDEAGYSTSVHSQGDQWLADLARAATNVSSDGQGATTDTAMMTSILDSMFEATSVATMEKTLGQLDSRYGTASRNNGASQASVSVYA